MKWYWITLIIIALIIYTFLIFILGMATMIEYMRESIEGTCKILLGVA